MPQGVFRFEGTFVDNPTRSFRRRYNKDQDSNNAVPFRRWYYCVTDRVNGTAATSDSRACAMSRWPCADAWRPWPPVSWCAVADSRRAGYVSPSHRNCSDRTKRASWPWPAWRATNRIPGAATEFAGIGVSMNDITGPYKGDWKKIRNWRPNTEPIPFGIGVDRCMGNRHRWTKRTNTINRLRYH